MNNLRNRIDSSAGRLDALQLPFAGRGHSENVGPSVDQAGRQRVRPAPAVSAGGLKWVTPHGMGNALESAHEPDTASVRTRRPASDHDRPVQRGAAGHESDEDGPGAVDRLRAVRMAPLPEHQRRLLAHSDGVRLV